MVVCTEMQAHLCGSPGKGRQKNLLSQPEYGVLGVLLSLGWLSPAARHQRPFLHPKAFLLL